MILYRWDKNRLILDINGEQAEQIFDDAGITVEEEIFAITHYMPPVLSCDGRYLAICTSQTLYIYDTAEKRLAASGYRSEKLFTNIVFDSDNRVYFPIGNKIHRMKADSTEPELVYDTGRSPHGIQYISVSPNSRYVSYCRYKSDSDRLYIYDTETAERIDPHVSVHDYVWLDNTRIVHCKLGALKILDLETLKSTVLIRDHRSIIKRAASAQDVQRLMSFRDAEMLYNDISLPGLYGGRIYFSLYIFGEAKNRYKSVWSVDHAGTEVRLCCELPDECIRYSKYMKFIDGVCYIPCGNKMHIIGENSDSTVDNVWLPVRPFYLPSYL